MSSGPSSSSAPFKNQEAKLDLKLQLAVKESAALKPEDLDKLRTERLAVLDAEGSPVGGRTSQMGYGSPAAAPTHADFCTRSTCF